jgi:hypothetical protein
VPCLGRRRLRAHHGQHGPALDARREHDQGGVADLAKRGKFVTVSQRATKYDIIVNGKTVSNKEVEMTVKTTDQKALAAGGHGEKTGGWNGNTPADATDFFFCLIILA